MIIGFDAKRAFYNPRGLGSYSRSLIRGLCGHHRDHQYYSYYGASKKAILSDARDLCTINQISKHSIPAYWRSFQIVNDIKRDGVDLYHGLSNELPYTSSAVKTKFVVTIHDLIFKKFEKGYSSIDRMIYHTKMKHVVKRADGIICVSNHTKNDLQEAYKIGNRLTRIVSPICDDIFFKERAIEELELLKNQLMLPKDFLLYVGALVENKNVSCLLKALKLADEIPLIIVGHGPMERQLKKFVTGHKLQNRVIFANDHHIIGRRELSMLYHLAAITIVPSFYEGFGLPVIESLASKTPVICADTSALPETLGPGGIAFDPKSFEALAEAINSLLSDEELCQKYANAGHMHSQNFQSKGQSEALMSIYSELVN